MTEMRIERDRVVSFHFLLTDDSGAEIDTSTGREPLVYLHGHENLFPAVEKALEGKTAGEVVKVRLTPEDAFGAHDPEYLVEVPRDRFDFEISVGDLVQGQDQDGLTQPFKVTKIGDNEVTLDGNHPLAGKSLNFTISIEEVREPTPEDLENLKDDESEN